MKYFEILLLLSSFFLLLRYSFRNKNGIPTKWPLVGTVPAFLKNQSRIHEFFVEVSEKTQLNFSIVGYWFTKMNLFVTVDPANVHHIFTTTFGNYARGPMFKEALEFLGDGIFNSNSEMWKFHRKMAQSTLSHPRFHKFMVKKIWEKIETGLIPILDHASMEKSEIELQDLFGRLTFDTICSAMIDYDPKTLCIDFPVIPFAKAVKVGEKATVYRLTVPTFVWKFQRWLNVGLEKKHKEALKILDDFLNGCISKKKKEMGDNIQSMARNDQVGVDLITLYMDELRECVEIRSNDDKFLRDTLLNYIGAGQETTSVTLCWFFYLLSENPHVLSKIKEELNAMIVQVQGDHKDILSRNFEELSEKVTYLHAAICETLRLYPPVAFNGKDPIESDTLPSGHQVDSSTKIIFDPYAMGRMKSIWGEDCYEFKPERWISDSGTIKYEPSNKFLAFGSGPRTCLGKNMSLATIKAVVMSIITKYHIQPVKEHVVVPDISLILHMKYGFKVNVAAY